MRHLARRRPLLGVPLEIDVTWFIALFIVAMGLGSTLFPAMHPGLSALVYWELAFFGALLFFVSLFLHEWSHGVVAGEHGLQLVRVRLFLLGGLAEIVGEPDTPKAEWQIAIAGPLCSLVMALSCMLAERVMTSFYPSSSVALLLQYLAVINGIVALFNLLPIFPLDGGRLLHALLWWITENAHTATRFTMAFGRGFNVLFWAVSAWAVLSGQWFLALWVLAVSAFLGKGLLHAEAR